MENTPTVRETTTVVAGFGNSDSFELMQRQAKLLAASQLVPKEFQGNLPNVVIALEMANRIGASPLSVMQNLYIVHGKPGWSSQFIIAAINASGKFSPLRFDITGEGDKKTCIAWALEKATDTRLESPPVSIDMAKKEGWYEKNGSKWKTMPDLMLRYRTATFFGRLYAPEILMGMKSEDEIKEVIDITPAAGGADIMERFGFTPPADGELPMTDKEKEASQEPPKTAKELLQECYQLLAAKAKETGDSPDDVLDALTKGKMSAQQDLEGLNADDLGRVIALLVA